MTVEQGEVFAHYQVGEKIGEGGMGIVYRAQDLRLQRDVALKVLPSGLLADDEARRRFRHEALALSQINHPNIATIHEFDSRDGVDYLVMELIPGTGLEERLKSGQMPEKEILPLAIQLAEGLAAAHERGVIHRDLKPANVRVTPDGRVKILDFGIARRLPSAAGPMTSSTLTQAGAVSGTLAYMAPEVLAGESADARADVFAFAVVLYEMATGTHPYPLDSPITLMYAMLNQAPRAPRAINPSLSAGLEAVILKGMNRDPSRRHANATELLEDLRRLTLSPTVPSRGATGPPPVEAIAVLPLENLSGDAAQDFFADGITEALIAELAKIGSLRIISRTSAMRYKGVRRPLPEIARELGVDAVVEGSVVRSGDRVRIIAQLIHAATDTHLWAETYDRDLRDILAVQSEAASAIAQEIEAKVSPQARVRLQSARQVDPVAYEAFLRGRYYTNRRSEDSLRRGIEYLHQAIETDPTYALAYAGLGNAYDLLGFFSHFAPREAFPRAKAAALRALEIDPSLSEAHVALAYVQLYFDWDWTASEASFRRAIELNPNNAQAHLWYANLLAARSRFDEALARVADSLKLDPLSLVSNGATGWVKYFQRDFESAISGLRNAQEMDRTFAPLRVWCSWPLVAAGLHEDAAAELEAAARSEGHTALIDGSLAYVLAKAETATRARGLLDELLERSKRRHVPSYIVAIAYDALGERDAAYEWMNKAVDERSPWLVFLDVEARFDGLRGDPRFEEIRKRVGV